MEATTRGSFVKARDWTRAHPFIAMAGVGVLSFLIGSGSSGARYDELQGRLSATNDKFHAAQSEIQSLQGQIDSVESENATLEEVNADLEEQLAKLSARRPLPNIVGKPVDRAQELEEKYGWDLNVSRRYANSKPGTILTQDPIAGTMMRYDAPFQVVVAKPIPRVPNVIGIARRREGWHGGNYDALSGQSISPW
jgi:hypothetical protein